MKVTARQHKVQPADPGAGWAPRMLAPIRRKSYKEMSGFDAPVEYPASFLVDQPATEPVPAGDLVGAERTT